MLWSSYCIFNLTLNLTKEDDISLSILNILDLQVKRLFVSPLFQHFILFFCRFISTIPLTELHYEPLNTSNRVKAWEQLESELECLHWLRHRDQKPPPTNSPLLHPVTILCLVHTLHLITVTSGGEMQRLCN